MIYGEAEYIRDYYGMCIGILDCQCQRNIAQRVLNLGTLRTWEQDDKLLCPDWRHIPERSWAVILDRLRRVPGAWRPA